MRVNKVDQYVKAATSDNTRRSYRSAIEHFEVSWGGFLPATSDSIARYLAEYGESLSINTLQQRLAALSKWHIEQGMPDPTKAPLVKKVLRGVRALHPKRAKSAKPLQLEQLEQLDNWFIDQINTAAKIGNRIALLKHTRNRALVLIGFWRGFRSDELSRLTIDHIHIIPNEGMTLFLQTSKTDRDHKGKTFKAPALSRLCPVTAYSHWLEISGLTSGPALPGINKWGNINNRAMHPSSFIHLLRDLFCNAGILSPESYSSHSLRRGFANWANSNGWDMKTLMEYVGWKDINSALRYIESTDPFQQRRINTSLLIAS